MPRWLKRSLLVLGVLVVVGVGAVVYLVAADRTSPVDVDEAVDRYQEDRDGDGSSSTVPQERPLPAEGVYVYETVGRESIDLLGGSTHDYPAETTVTITHTECGLLQLWSALEERSDEEEHCTTAAGRSRVRLEVHHEFFGIDDDQSFTCEPGYVVFPAEIEVGAEWPTTCTADAARLEGTGRVVGTETILVGGAEVETVHVRITEDATGSSTGPSRDDYWWRLDDGLLIQRESSVDTRSESPVGVATYRESYTLRLTSLTPRT